MLFLLIKDFYIVVVGEAASTTNPQEIADEATLFCRTKRIGLIVRMVLGCCANSENIYNWQVTAVYQSRCLTKSKRIYPMVRTFFDRHNPVIKNCPKYW
jgi:hypothetical protein